MPRYGGNVSYLPVNPDQVIGTVLVKPKFPQQKQSTIPAPLQEAIKAYNPDFDFPKLEAALKWWKENPVEAPEPPGVDDHFSHPLAIVGKLVKFAEADQDTIIASVLYPSARAVDGDGWDNNKLYDIKKKFGAKVQTLVERTLRLRALKTPKLKPGATQTDEDQHSLYLLMGLRVARDTRVFLIRHTQLADNLEREVQARKNKGERAGLFTPETTERMIENVDTFHAPLAYLAGKAAIRTEMRDLCYQLENPDGYKKTCEIINASVLEKDREAGIGIYAAAIEEKFGWKHGVEFRIASRSKSPSSTREKALRKNISEADLIDLFGMRVDIEPSAVGFAEDINTLDKKAHDDLLAKLGKKDLEVFDFLSREFGCDNKEDRYISERLSELAKNPACAGDVQRDDYITNPKPNGYSAVQGLMLWPFKCEVQVVDRLRHRNNRLGKSGHDLYKTIKTPKYAEFIRAGQEVLKRKDQSGSDRGPTIVRDQHNQCVILSNEATLRDFFREAKIENCTEARVIAPNIPRNEGLTIGPSTVLESGWQIIPL